MIVHKFGKIALFAILLLIISGFIYAEPVTVQLHLAITEAMKAEPPTVIDNHLVLTYKGDRTFRFVGAAFKHEDFKVIHPFYKNSNGIYVLTYPLQEGISYLEYRIVADGLWMPDPENNNVTVDSGGLTLSCFIVPEKEGPPESPQNDHGVLTFHYFGAPNQKVYLYGDFNDWDPFMYRMKEGAGASYKYTIRLSPGKYRYKFIVEGTAMADPLNDNKVIDIFGQTASVFTIDYEH